MLLPYRRVSMQTCSSGTLLIQPRAGDGIQNSMNIPQKSRASLDGQRFQVVVIGGGINGVAIARECARAKRRTLLLEQNDFGSGTTSRSTRIIHGGLRYLEFGEIGLVRQSLRERQQLLRERPHLVHTVQFLLALGENSRRSAMKIRMGLWLYRRLGGKTRVADGAADRARFERLLDSGQRWSIFNFEDAQCEFPERLVAEWLVAAADSGAVVRNYAQVLAVDVAYGRAKGLLFRDLLTGTEQRIEAGWIINATGPWVDRLCQRSAINTHGPMIGGVRGSHIVLPRFAGAPDAAVFTEAVDGRPIFLIPWNEQVMVGTTEVPDQSDPSKTQPSAEEIEYLLNSLHALFPGAKVFANDVHYAFAGVRPLPFMRGRNPSAITRRHFLHDHGKQGVQHMISVIGGKLTTAAELARQCARKIRIPVAEPKGLATLAEGEIAATMDDWIAEISGLSGISENAAEAIVTWHGKRTLAVAQLARSGAQMRATLCPHSEHIVAEAVDAFQHEYAVTLGDVLLRRVPVAMAACWTEECSRVAASRIAAALGWSKGEEMSELEALERERSAFLVKPSTARADSEVPG
ncbi:MAG TPA: glycerol-3-phosphate dehydrogenase/oxidase [Terriglobales bacterium]|nr:glycerol-3-phosphate dehydrogenase/oxidase [Terriglobales bacterium]